MSLCYVSVFYSFFTREATSRPVTLDDATPIFWTQEELTDYPPFLNKVNNTIDWKPVQDMLMKFYETSKAKEGERAYSPLLLFRCMLFQKWFQIKLDPELESQINDFTFFAE